MFTPLVDILRCPNVHEDTWLVASIERSEERDIREGMLGCPVCLAEYPIRDGIVRFADVPSVISSEARDLHVPREADAIRLAAALDLTDARLTAVLVGACGALAPIVRGVSPAQLLLVNPPLGIASGDGVSIVQATAAPLARGSVDAVAFDAAASESMIASLVASLKGGGRMLGPAAAPLPEGLTELARDDDVWVAQLAPGAMSSPVQLKRRPAG
jgi:uncharacterized protein YbaR (Trm112 family)